MLDVKSLRNASLVSKTWNAVIKEGKIWNLLLEEEVSHIPSQVFKVYLLSQLFCQ